MVRSKDVLILRINTVINCARLLNGDLGINGLKVQFL